MFDHKQPTRAFGSSSFTFGQQIIIPRYQKFKRRIASFRNFCPKTKRNFVNKTKPNCRPAIRVRAWVGKTETSLTSRLTLTQYVTEYWNRRRLAENMVSIARFYGCFTRRPLHDVTESLHECLLVFVSSNFVPLKWKSWGWEIVALY